VDFNLVHGYHQSHTVISPESALLLGEIFWVTQFLTVKKTLKNAFAQLAPRTRNPS
jgi:hypothetical protein